MDVRRRFVLWQPRRDEQVVLAVIITPATMTNNTTNTNNPPSHPTPPPPAAKISRGLGVINLMHFHKEIYSVKQHYRWGRQCRGYTKSTSQFLYNIPDEWCCIVNLRHSKNIQQISVYSQLIRDASRRRRLASKHTRLCFSSRTPRPHL